MQKIILLCLLFMSTLASAMTGTLEVTAGDLRVKRQDGFKVHFYQGRYQAQVDLQRQEAWIRIERNGINTDITLRYPSGTQIPTNGPFTIDGTQTGQTFQMNGVIQTSIQDSLPVRDREPCTYYRDEWVCEWHQGQQWCHWEQVPVAGWRNVEYFYRTQVITLNADLRSDNGGKANFSGQDSNRRKVYNYYGQCY